MCDADEVLGDSDLGTTRSGLDWAEFLPGVHVGHGTDDQFDEDGGVSGEMLANPFDEVSACSIDSAGAIVGGLGAHGVSRFW